MNTLTDQLTDQLTAIDIVMNASEGVNLTGEVMQVYSNYQTDESYENLSCADMQRVDSLFARLMLAFNLKSAGVKDYYDDSHTCFIFNTRSENLLKRFGKDYISAVLTQALIILNGRANMRT